MWITVAVIADVSAVIAVLGSGARMVVAVIGLCALLAGIYQLAVRWGRPVDWRIAMATVTMIAGSAALVVVTQDALTEDQPPTTAATGGDTGNPSSAAPRPTPSNTPSASAPPPPAGELSLLDAKRVGDDEARFTAGPLTVDTRLYEQVLYNHPGCAYLEPISETYQVDRKYGTFGAEVGIGDDTTSEARVRFTVLADGVVRHTETVALGQTVPFEADITGAFRIEIRTQVMENATCKGTVYAAWIDPVVTP
ncbi:NPCBM/NEW2 domain-containing protein [Micromonospora sp. NPDC049900]|uniref:NPCBM/NEW2 domain-containing protein n=1 Tax=Micromonospora sp. NPDC049900 TaxID=3364275 RepID=UPI0037BB6696